MQRPGGEAQGPGAWSVEPKVWGPPCPTIWLGYLALGPITEINGRLASAAELRARAPLHGNESPKGPAICALEKKLLDSSEGDARGLRGEKQKARGDP